MFKMEETINLENVVNPVENSKLVLRCVKCNSKGIYTTRIERVCRTCGHRVALTAGNN